MLSYSLKVATLNGSALFPEYRQAYANGQRDLYPKSLRDMFEVMKTVPTPKQKKPAQSKETKKNKEELESSFAQKSEKKPAPKSEKPDKEAKNKRACHCCGKPGCYPKKCHKEKV